MIGRLFRRWRKPAKPAPRDCRNMNENWEPGDLAMCIDDRFHPIEQGDPKKGDVLRVVRIVQGTSKLGDKIVYGLGFEGKPANDYWETVCFRKLRPVQEPAEAKWAQWLKDTLRTPEHVR